MLGGVARMGCGGAGRMDYWLGKRETAAVWTLIIAGCLLRLGWLLAGDHLAPTISEMFNVSRRFATDGVLGDAFRTGQGPTAHVMPLSPIMAGTIYRLLGIGSPISELTLSCIAISFTLASFLLIYKTFRLLETPLWARLAALALACLLPVNLALETIAFRTWEGALAVFLTSLVLLQTVRADISDIPPKTADYARLSFVCALAFFINQASGLACFAMLALLAFRRGGFVKMVLAGLISALFLLALFTPWMLRNQHAMGQPLWLRSNFGIVLATGFHEGASRNGDQRQAFVDRLHEIDPLMSDQAYARLKAEGEIAYNRELRDNAKAWIAGHKRESALLCLRYLAQYYYPPAWLWHVYSDQSQATWMKAGLHWLISTLGIAGLAFAIWQRRRAYAYASLGVILPALPYMLAQPVLRYRYLVFALLLFLAVDFVGRISSGTRLAR